MCTLLDRFSIECSCAERVSPSYSVYGTVVSRLGIYSGSDDVRGTRISYVCESVHLQITILFVFSVRVPGWLGGGAVAIRVYVWTLSLTVTLGAVTLPFTAYGPGHHGGSRRRRRAFPRGVAISYICACMYYDVAHDWEIVCLSRPAPPRRHGNSSLKYEDTPFILKRTVPPWPEKRDWALRVPVPAGPVADSTASPHVSCANINHTQRATASARNDDGDRSAEGNNREGG